MGAFDQPRRTDSPGAGRPAVRRGPSVLGRSRLEALAGLLRERGFRVEYVPVQGGLRVKSSVRPQVGDLVTCRARMEDGHRLWFFSSWRQPIAYAGDLDGAVAEISRYLERRP